jgi:hypothetical protein
MRPGRPDPKWYLAGSPLLICIVSFFDEQVCFPAVRPKSRLAGIFFGLPAGFLEEIGWTGFVLAHMIQGRIMFERAMKTLTSAGHRLSRRCRVMDSSLFAFFLAFTAAMTAVRVFIARVFVNWVACLETRALI